GKGNQQQNRKNRKEGMQYFSNQVTLNYQVASRIKNVTLRSVARKHKLRAWCAAAGSQVG
ncbi:MAG: hypothetical protein V3V86_05455, partial [Gammaproteobacteria bacterium]